MLLLSSEHSPKPTTAVVRGSVMLHGAVRVRAAFLKLRMLHRDQQGTISILSVIVILLLTMLLGMILNVGEQIDDKIRLQNAADAATYSGGVVIARGMNTIAFTNHLLSETFALTAYFREGRDRYAESLVPQILDAWEAVGPQMSQSQFAPIRNIQPAMAPKIQMERQVVKTFGEMTAVKSKFLLPALEAILGQPEQGNQAAGNGGGGQNNQQSAAQSHLIPRFQRQVVQATAAAANTLTQEIMKRHLVTLKAKSGTPVCILYTSETVPVQFRTQTDPYERIVPALDPSFEGPDFMQLRAWEAGTYQSAASKRRRDLATRYLSDWNNDVNFDLGPFERESLGEGGRVSAKMSQFINLWKGFTCAKLNQLLDVEFPQTNLPHMLRTATPGTSQQEYLDHDFMFSGIVYRKQRQQTMPGMYRVPNSGDATAFARVALFVPRPRYESSSPCPTWSCPSYDWWGKLNCGIPCFDSWPTEWSLFNQNWAARIVPASAESSLSMLNENPQDIAPGVKPPNVGAMTIQDFKAVNTH
ncbi:MAG: hypothetical protein JWM11_2039 [Planctomycetaceae bacterium]|nr:hypothetical protein [Planctomycetaceae bacterium]